jgi:prepilin-type N-terminal cleavage/methylation domain-containing protein
MRRLLSAQGGFSMIEVMVAMALTTIVMGISMTAFTSLWDEHKTTTQHNEALDEARTASDRLARDLRNLASPTALRNLQANRPQAVELAEPFQMVFRTVDEQPLPVGSQNTANLMRVRYCVDRSVPTKATLYQQTQRWTTAAPPAIPSTGACPGTGWPQSKQVTTNLVNAIDPANQRAVFYYDAPTTEQITQLRTELFVDATPLERPAETKLVTGVFLRNQNQFPTAAFTVTMLNATTRTVRLDGSASTDPEGQSLRYCWYLNPPATLPDCTATPAPASLMGEGIVFSTNLPAGSNTIVLQVEDQAGLRDEEVITYP